MIKKTNLEIERLIQEESRRAEDENIAATTSPIRLSEQLDVHAYVLLGDPGMGKSTCFRQEALATNGHYVPARDFIHGLTNLPSVLAHPIFIDGLDETRARNVDGRGVLDAVRKRLRDLGSPRFRISCRANDWLGQSDAQALARSIPNDAQLRVYRLLPLSDADIRNLLALQDGIGSVDEFIEQAHRVGLESLLRNPQTLRILSSAFLQAGKWPATKIEAFALACTKLAQEENFEHQVAKRADWPRYEELVETAGALSVVMLCADLSSLATDNAVSPTSFPIGQLTSPLSGMPSREAVSTGLFSAISDREIVPVHRSVAEFLGARYLADVIENHPFPDAITRLVTSTDGKSISSLRGICAWLAALSKRARWTLIDADSYAPIFNGDIALFDTSDKIYLLQKMREQSGDYAARGWPDWSQAPIELLVTSDVLSWAYTELSASNRTGAHQIMCSLILDSIEKSKCLKPTDAAFVVLVEKIARDKTFWQRIRQTAIEILFHYEPQATRTASILEDISHGNIEDENDELAGNLLSQLFPKFIGPKKILNFFWKAKDQRLIGTFHMFWAHRAAERCPRGELPNLMEAIGQELSQDRTEQMLTGLISRSLERALVELGDDADDDVVLKWLEVGLAEHSYSIADLDAQNVIGNWLKERLERHLGLFKRALLSSKNIYEAEALFPGCNLPPQMGKWWLEVAGEISEESIAEQCFFRAVGSLVNSNDQSLTLDDLFRWVESSRRFETQLGRVLVCDWPSPDDGHRAKRKSHELTVANRALSFKKQLRAALEAESLKIDPRVIYDLSLKVHPYDLNEQKKGTADTRLLAFVEDPELVRLAWNSIINTPFRTDLPTVEATVSTLMQSQSYWIMRPILLAAEMAVEASSLASWPDSSIRLACLQQFSSPLQGATSSPFFNEIAHFHPALVQEVAFQYGAAAFEHGTLPSALISLARSNEYRNFITPVVRNVLASATGRVKATQRAVYMELLAVLSESEDILDAQNFLDSEAQKTELGCDALLMIRVAKALGDDKIEELACAIGTSRGRARRALRFLQHCQRELGPQLSAYMIKKLGPYHLPREDSGWRGSRYDVAGSIQRFIRSLGAHIDESAGLALSSLLASKDILNWRGEVERAYSTHLLAYRDATHKFLTPQEILQVIRGQAISNVDVLKALVEQELQKLLHDIRNDPLDRHLGFWNVDRYGRQETPKPEEACRDYLFGLLAERVSKYKISLDTESRHHDRKRSDALVTFGDVVVPVEVKKDSNDDVWNAVENQLIPQYSRDPRAQGHGIYLVLWFGDDSKRRRPPIGDVPIAADEMLEMLRAQLPAESHRRISIYVTDLSRTVGRRRT